ncbi:MAG TPA: ABC transporter permease, partial [Clostridiaceae bacterium]|nr:ABC transporter permease [Clostridiaceae bacterium]
LNNNIQEAHLLAAKAAKKEHRKEKWIKAYRFIRSNKKLLFGAITFFVILLVAIFADQIAPYHYATIGTGARFEKPSSAHLFGTDNFQRDIFSRVVYGTRISLSVGVICVGIALVIGVPAGLLAGYLGGWVDLILMRICDVLLSIPWVLMAVAVTAISGPGIHVVYIAMGIVHAPGFMRIMRSMVLSIREREYVDAAVQLGESKLSILFRYILPNSAGVIIVRAAGVMAGAVLSEAAISYIGYGTQPPNPSWGLMLTDSQGYLWQQPWMAVFPGIAIVLLVLSVNLFGDGLRDLLDPRYKGKVMN